MGIGVWVLWVGNGALMWVSWHIRHLHWVIWVMVCMCMCLWVCVWGLSVDLIRVLRMGLSLVWVN